MNIFAIDVSGSMDGIMLANIKNHLLKNARTGDRVLMFDTRVLKVTTPHDAVYGGAWPSGGGTLIEPVIEWRDANAPDGHLVIMSDGYFAGRSSAPNAEVILVGDIAGDHNQSLTNHLAAHFDKVSIL